MLFLKCRHIPNERIISSTFRNEGNMFWTVKGPKSCPLSFPNSLTVSFISSLENAKHVPIQTLSLMAISYWSGCSKNKEKKINALPRLKNVRHHWLVSKKNHCSVQIIVNGARCSVWWVCQTEQDKKAKPGTESDTLLVFDTLFSSLSS